MFASERASTANPPFSVVSARPVQHTLPGHQPHVSEGAATTLFWAPKEQPINLRRCDDEPALEYGCVDWFLYDKQRSQ
jgi:hypothetical protein